MVAGPRRIDLAKIMTMSPNTPDLDALLAHSGWVRTLAQSLVTDPATADDVAQQAWQTALERPPRHGSNLRSWWSSVVRSSAGKGWREQASRQRLEQKLEARQSTRASDRPEELAERLDTFRRLASAVAQLPEPYGSAIYLRFFEELSVKEVAKRQGLPLATAQSHITRGLERLRGALHKDLGETWRSRCLLFAVPIKAAPWISLGPLTILAMNTKTTLSLVAGLLAILTLFLWNPWAAPELSHDDGLLAAGTYDEVPANQGASGMSAAELSAAGVVREEQVLDLPAGTEGTVGVRIRDAATLEPIANAVVHYLPYSTWKIPEVSKILREEKLGPYERITRFGEPFQADASGVLQLPTPDQRFSIVAENGNSFGYRWFFDPAEVSGGFEILLYPEIQVTVEVRNESGQPVEGAAVGFSHSTFAYTSAPSLEVSTDADGKATFEHLELETFDNPDRPGSFALLVPSAPAQRVQVPAAELPKAHLSFVMPQTGTVEVEALDGSGFPLDNGTPVVLQLANDAAKAVASGGDPEARNRWSMQLSESMQIAYVREGVATFPKVGIGTELAVASYDDEANGHAVVIAQGPTQAGDVVRTTIALSKAPGELRFRFVDRDGQQVELPKGHRVTLSGMDAQNSGFGHGNTPQRLEDGTYRIPLIARELEAKELWLATSPPRSKGTSDFSFGVQRLDVSKLKKTGQVYEVPFASSVLLDCTVVDTAGVPLANQGMTWEVLSNANVAGDWRTKVGASRLYERWEQLVTDKDGRLIISGPPPPLDCQFRLTQGGEDRTFAFQRTPLDFELSSEPQTIVVAMGKPIKGRIVIDDPAMLEHLLPFYGTGSPDQPGFASTPMELELPNGRFEIPAPALGQGPVSIVIRSLYTRETLQVMVDVASAAKEVNGELVLPDLDLRGKLFVHQIQATSGSGEPVADLRVEGRFQWFQDLPAEGMILSTQPVEKVKVRARGYLAQEIFLNGVTPVVLEQAPTMTIRLQPALPRNSEVTWRLHLLRTVNHDSLVLSGEGNLNFPIEGEKVIFSLPEEGMWGIGLQATVKGKKSESQFTGAYVFPSGSPFAIFDLGDQPGYHLTLNLQADALQAALDEALEEAGLSQD